MAEQVKKGPLAETSPMLNDISAVPSWSKVGALAAARMLALHSMHELSTPLHVSWAAQRCMQALSAAVPAATRQLLP